MENFLILEIAYSNNESILLFWLFYSSDLGLILRLVMELVMLISNYFVIE